ncbi:MAG TPA: ATP-binding protein [Steroidobacteraceae bacterium]|jgi:PAS domain S-box-containing protein
MNTDISTDIDDCGRLEEDTHARWWLWAPAREHQFRSVCDRIPSLISLVTPSGEIQIANQFTLQYSGATLEELCGRATTEGIHPDDLPNVMAAWGESIRTCRPYRTEARRRRVDSAYRWFDMHGFPLEDTQGRVACWYVLDRDIDDQKRAEALLAGEKRFLEMVASGCSMPAVLNALCQLVENTVDGCRCSVLLVDPTGTHLETGAAPSLPPSFIASLNGRAVEVGSGPCAMAAYLNEQVIAPDIESETRWVASAWCESALSYDVRACWSTPITSTDGKVLGAFAVYYDQPRTPTAQDLSLIEQLKHIASIAVKRVLNDAALRRSETCLTEGQRLSLTGSFVWNVATDQHYWSAETYRIFEYDASSAVTMQLIVDRVLPQDVSQMMQALELAAQGKGFDVECRIQTPGGAVKHIHIVAHGSRDREGRLECIGAVQNVTQHRLSEEALGKVRSELAHVSRITALGAMTASIAHEVNQPLTSIIANATTGMRYLATDPPNVGKAREAIQRTIHDGSHAADVISGLRALFRKQHATTESVDMNAALEEVVALSRSELQNSQVIVRTELANDLPPIFGDRVQLQQVVLNLLLNAAEAMSGIDDRPRQLTIWTAQEQDDGVRLSVQDAGIGLEPQTVNRLFDAFYTTKSSGMGIGLSVSRSIIEGHGGRLWATPNEGPGATFSFSIPQRAARTIPMPVAAIPGANPTLAQADVAR